MLHNKFLSKFFILFVVSLLFIGYGCSSENDAVQMNENNKIATKSSDVKDKILADPIFQELVENQYYFYKNADKDKVADLIADDKIDDDEAKVIPIVFGFNRAEDFQNWRIEQYNRMTYMENTYSYSKFTEEEQTGLWFDALNNSGLPPLVKPIEQPKDPGYETYMSCNAQFNWCTAGAISAGGAAHLACIGADVTSGGLAAYLCHSLAITFQSSLHAACQAQYDTCMGRD